MQKIFNILNSVLLPNPPVNILLKLDDGWFLVSLTNNVSSFIKENYQSNWREYSGIRFEIYYNKLEITEKLLLILQIKYGNVLDNTKYKSNKHLSE